MPSNCKKCTRPDLSPATIVRRLGATAQERIALSPVKVAITFLVCQSQTLSVKSREPETRYLPSTPEINFWANSTHSTQVDSNPYSFVFRRMSAISLRIHSEAVLGLMQDIRRLELQQPITLIEHT
jgi:hypothetical protein